MLAALLFSLTVVPPLCSLLLKEDGAAPPAFVLRLQGGYRRTLDSVLARPLPLVLGLLIALGGSVLLFQLVGRTFMPVLDEGDIIVQLNKSPSISLPASVDIDRQLGQALKSVFRRFARW
jgi:cobalt-zinc-cadmium resistance protein CzcA